MLEIQAVNHVGIRVSDKAASIGFYEILGFELRQDAGFDQGHPVIMRHPSGVVVNLLGPANASQGSNVLMDVPEKYPQIRSNAASTLSRSPGLMLRTSTARSG